MTAVVIDASALAAVLFEEPEAEAIRASVAGAMLAPGLIRYELASVCLSKAMRYPGRASDIHARHELVGHLDLTLFEPDWLELPRLARRWALSAYDAAYLQVALAHDAPLVTLDSRLAAAYDSAIAAG
jgi:predicted nucleic acid-binding protein